MIPIKLAIVRERWGVTIEPIDGSRIALWKEYRTDGRRPSRSEPQRPAAPGRSGIELHLRRGPMPSAEFTLRGVITGPVEPEVVRRARNDLKGIMEHVRTLLQNLEERRASPRFPVDFPVRIYPLYPDGIVGLPMAGRCKDISNTGARLVSASPVWTERIYVEFFEIRDLSAHAVYLRVVRAMQDPETQGTITAGRFTSRG